MEVSLNLEATKALTWVVNIAGIDPKLLNTTHAINTVPLELGYRVRTWLGTRNGRPRCPTCICR